MLEETERVLSKYIRRYRTNPKKYKMNVTLEQITLGVINATGVKPNFSVSNPLTIAELLCLIFMVSGKEADVCAKLLNISQHSIRTYEKRAREKLVAKNRAHAFYLALVKGYIAIVD